MSQQAQIKYRQDYQVPSYLVDKVDLTFDNLAANSGLRFVYEPADDSSAIGSGSLSGTLNVRADIRISGNHR